MANLVPLHLDKDTGQLVAPRNPGIAPPGGGGGGVAGAEGFFHLQGIASSAWSIVHNQATDLLLVQVYTEAGDQIIPDEITLIDINTVEITFAQATTGRAHIIFFEPV